MAACNFAKVKTLWNFSLYSKVIKIFPFPLYFFFFFSNFDFCFPFSLILALFFPLFEHKFGSFFSVSKVGVVPSPQY